MKRVAIIALVAVGAFFGLVWWFDVEQTGGSFHDFFADPVGGTTSLFTRLGFRLNAMLEKLKGQIGATSDPVAIADGIIAGFETFAPEAYPDPPGQTDTYSIGYGHQIVQGDNYDSVPPNNVINEADALTLLSDDLGNAVACVNAAVKVPLAPEQAAALYSLCYNIGCPAFQKSTLVRDLNANDYAAAQAQFAVWNHSKGVVLQTLTDRRASEAALFTSATAPTTEGTSGNDPNA